jgi:response regulator NasT
MSRLLSAIVESAPRIVVAEDEALIRMDLVEMLQEAGFNVVGQAGDGRAAVDLARSLTPDLVILDVKMPILDGISAAEQIVAEDLASVLMLTAFGQRSLVQRAVEAGAMGYVVKPFTAADVVPAVEIALARGLQMKTLRTEVSGLEGALEARKVIDRAKALVIRDRGVTEAEAFRFIQTTAMHGRVSMREVAEQILEDAEAPS